MTGDIRTKLLNSDAALSLEMEARIASLFDKAGWPTSQSTYYVDPVTTKIREIDGFTHRTFWRDGDKPEIIVNSSILFECKSLRGQHVILMKSKPMGITAQEEDYNARFHPLWLGNEYIWEERLLSRISSYFGLTTAAKINDVHSYLLDRSYPGGRSLVYQERVRLPTVSVVSAAMRETNGDKTRDENASVIWGTTLGLFSAMEVMEKNYIERGLSWILPETVIVNNITRQNVAVFFDKEVLRLGYVHPIIFLKGTLWKLENGDLREINSGRLIIGELDHERRYVDFVTENGSEEYVKLMTKQLAMDIKSSVTRIKRRVNRLRRTLSGESDTLEELLTAG